MTAEQDERFVAALEAIGQALSCMCSKDAQPLTEPDEEETALYEMERIVRRRRAEAELAKSETQDTEFKLLEANARRAQLIVAGVNAIEDGMDDEESAPDAVKAALQRKRLKEANDRQRMLDDRRAYQEQLAAERVAAEEKVRDRGNNGDDQP
jgi:hypothetical protein